MSSANRKSLEDDESGRRERLLIKIRKRSGPRIDPCGTPEVTGSDVENDSLTRTC